MAITTTMTTMGMATRIEMVMPATSGMTTTDTMIASTKATAMADTTGTTTMATMTTGTADTTTTTS